MDCKNFARRAVFLMIVALMLPLLLCAGCSESTEVRSGEVSGKVTLEGQPLTAGIVLFMTEDGHAASVPIGTDGSYTLQIRPDRFKVAVTPPEDPDPLASPPAGPKSGSGDVAISRRYRDLSSSGLTFDAKEGSNTFNIELKK